MIRNRWNSTYSPRSYHKQYVQIVFIAVHKRNNPRPRHAKRGEGYSEDLSGQGISGDVFAGEPTRPGKGDEAFGGTLARPREASNDFDEGAEEAGWRDGHEAEVARA